LNERSRGEFRMRRTRKKNKSFRETLEMYLNIKGLDIIVQLKNGKEIHLDKNRKLIDDVIITMENGRKEKKIPLSKITSVDLYAA
jgi:hypothetical protein